MRQRWCFVQKRLSKVIYERDGYTCRYCRYSPILHSRRTIITPWRRSYSAPALTVDHIIPISKGGTNDPENLQTLCTFCNGSKGARTMDEWKWNKRLQAHLERVNTWQGLGVACNG
ncbi:HNH endonuclease [Candidatus Pacearchaeota archaeon]|nr:HNH endonuclease [Candidatus Pacearchaeota archaeon]